MCFNALFAAVFLSSFYVFPVPEQIKTSLISVVIFKDISTSQQSFGYGIHMVLKSTSFESIVKNSKALILSPFAMNCIFFFVFAHTYF